MIKKERTLSSPYSYEQDYEFSIEEPIEFWNQVAKCNIRWDKLYSNVFNKDNNKWFENGKLNTCYNVLDKHIENGRSNEIAMVHEIPLKNIIKQITYKELYDQVCIFSRALLDIGLVKGDVVLVYLPNSIETVVAMLSCARIGAIHNVVFGGQLSGNLADNMEQCKPKLIITTNAGYVFGSVHNFLHTIKETLLVSKHKVNHVVVLNRVEFNNENQQEENQNGNEGQLFLDWNQLLEKSKENPYREYQVLDSSDPLYILFTSGSTNKPKGIVRENGDHLVMLDYLIRKFNGLKQGEVYFTKASMGWVSGVTWSTYGCLLVGVKSIVVEGSFKDGVNDFWSLIERNKVNQWMTTPSIVRALIKEDPNGEIASSYNLSSLNKATLASEKSQPETLSYLEHIIFKRPIVVNEYGTTETGILCVGYPSLQFKARNDSIGKPMPGYQFKIVSKDSNNSVVELGPNEIGELAIKLPLPPACVNRLYGDTESKQLYNQQYMDEFPGYFNSGDSSYYDKDGYFFYTSRSNDSISISGYTVNNGVIENELFKHPNINDCCVIGIHDDISFQQPIALLVLQNELQDYDNDLPKLKSQLNKLLQDKFSICFELKHIIIVKRLPKTKTTKKIKSIINSIFNGKSFTIPSSIEDESVVDELIEEYNKYKKSTNQ